MIKEKNEELKNRRASRIIFVQFLFSNCFAKTTLTDIKNVFLEEEIQIEVNKEFLKTLNDNFTKNKKKIEELIEKHNQRKNNVDLLLMSVIKTAVSELFFNDFKVVSSEYLKICDTLEIKGSFLNGILNQINQEINSNDQNENPE